MTFAHQATVIARKDLLIEVRGRQALGTLLPFAATVLVVRRRDEREAALEDHDPHHSHAGRTRVPAPRTPTERS